MFGCNGAKGRSARPSRNGNVPEIREPDVHAGPRPVHRLGA